MATIGNQDELSSVETAITALVERFGWDAVASALRKFQPGNSRASMARDVITGVIAGMIVEAIANGRRARGR